MKRTLIVATTSYAGMGPYVSEIVNTFSPEDDICFFFHDYEDDFFRRNIKKDLHEKSVFYREANSSFNKLKSLILNNEGYEKLIFNFCKIKKIELVHYINGIPSIAVQNRMEKFGITVLSTVHDLVPHEAKKAWYKMLRQKIRYMRLNENLRKAKFLVTNSMEQYDNLKRKYPNKEIAFHSFPSLVTKDIAEGKDIPIELKNIIKPYILFFGRIEEYKGVHLLYQAFMESSLLQNMCNLVIAGSGQLGFTRVQDDDGVIFLNRYIKDSEVAYLYKNAHCVVYPYISATQSGVLSLAFFYQTPVLASDVTFFKGIIEKSGTGLLFENGNVEDLKHQLSTLMKLDTNAMKYKQNLYYKENYERNTIHTNLLNLYAMEWTETESNSNFQESKITNKDTMKKWIKADYETYEMQHPLAARFTYGENWELFAY